jgi:hypothetical protein
VREVTTTELLALSNNEGNSEQFMNFLRYVDMLAPSDNRKLKGQMLRDKVFELEKY